jgi:uncharacterized protein
MMPPLFFFPAPWLGSRYSADGGFKMIDRIPLPQAGIVIEPIQMVVMQSTAGCNMNCDYCYLSEASRKSNRTFPIASIQDLFSNIFTSRHAGESIVVVWHSGEPLLLKPAYYDEAIDTIRRLAKKHRGPDFKIRFDMQTNGTLIDDEWCAFFLRHRDEFDLGVSCDGPAPLHDAHRTTWSGKPTHQRVVRGLDRLCRAGIRFNMIAVVPPSALDFPDELFDFVHGYRENLTDFHFNFMDAPVASIRDFTCTKNDRERYHRFLNRLLQRSAECDGTTTPVQIRNFSHVYKKMFASPEIQEQLSARSMSRPFRTLNVEVNGDVTTFYAGLTSQEYKDLYGDGVGLVVGNALKQPLDEIADSPKLQRIANDFEISHRACETGCDYFTMCSGGFNLTKYVRFGTFDATETPECCIHTKTMVDAVIDDLNAHVEKRAAARIVPAAASASLHE